MVIVCRRNSEAAVVAVPEPLQRPLSKRSVDNVGFRVPHTVTERNLLDADSTGLLGRSSYQGQQA